MNKTFSIKKKFAKTLTTLNILFALLLSCFPVQEVDGQNYPNVYWSPSTLNITLQQGNTQTGNGGIYNLPTTPQGDTQSKIVSFYSPTALSNAQLVIDPSIARFLYNAYPTPGNLAAWQRKNIFLFFRTPLGTMAGMYEGNIQIRNGNETLLGSLRVKINVVTFNEPQGDPLEQPLPEGALSLANVTPDKFNPRSAPLVFTLSDSEFYQNPLQDDLVLKVNGNRVPDNKITLETNAITATSVLVDGRNDISLSTVDKFGRPLFYNTTVWAGSNTLNVNLVDANGIKIMDQSKVIAKLSDDHSVFAEVSTTNGAVQLQNLPTRTILIEASSTLNRYGVTGIIGSQGTTQVKLLGFNPVSSVNNNDFSQGTAGWTIGNAPVQIVPHIEGFPGQSTFSALSAEKFEFRSERPKMKPAAQTSFSNKFVLNSANAVTDNDLSLSTSGIEPQSVSRTFNTAPGTSSVELRFRFITSEVPGGYFGSQFNDYFSVSLRSQQGGKNVSEGNSMNGLGLGAFDYSSGATAWRNVILPVNPQGDTIQTDAVVANVGDGALQSQVVIDSIKEVKDQVKPSIKWNNMQGGIDLSYEVTDGALAQNTTINVYWANGAGYSNRIDDPVFSYVVPSGTAQGQHGPIHINGNLLADDPTGVTHLIVASSETNIGTLKDVQITYGASADSTVVSEEMKDIVKDGLRSAGQSTATITSTARTTADQARAMFQNLTRDRNNDGQLTTTEIATNINIQLNGDGDFQGYGAAGDAVINVFEQQIAGLTPAQVIANQATIRAAMDEEIIDQGPTSVSRHCADPAKISVVDVGASAFNNNNGSLFVSAVQGRVSKFLDERSSNKCYHLEVNNEM